MKLLRMLFRMPKSLRMPKVWGSSGSKKKSLFDGMFASTSAQRDRDKAREAKQSENPPSDLPRCRRA